MVLQEDSCEESVFEVCYRNESTLASINLQLVCSNNKKTVILNNFRATQDSGSQCTLNHLFIPQTVLDSMR